MSIINKFNLSGIDFDQSLEHCQKHGKLEDYNEHMNFEIYELKDGSLIFFDFDDKTVKAH